MHLQCRRSCNNGQCIAESASVALVATLSRVWKHFMKKTITDTYTGKSFEIANAIFAVILVIILIIILVIIKQNRSAKLSEQHERNFMSFTDMIND